ncbi:neurexin-4-like [Lingula anatina]|uniref:Neurexin-4-like n=1 Tax=Lingula anatina TaxID=7574 RepID=A0A2R2MRA2_LINAN|nr:neurexin-4-like [Lingula anatina]|eukprot:XP_023932542.1 neurexin-4-like [Lingula anatina]
MAGALAILFAASLLALHGSSADCEDEVPEGSTNLEKRVAVLEFQLRRLFGGKLMQSRRSCSDWLADGFLTSRHYIVDPDGLRGVPEFQVWCDMTVSPPIAMFHHDQEDRTLINGFEEPGKYHLKISYAISRSQMKALMKMSGPCSQHIKYECHGALIRNEDSNTAYSWWFADGQEVKSYWPGGNAQVGGCECYKTKSCNGGKKCNCNVNDIAWREDSGDVTDKEALPVTGFRLGDSGDGAEKAFITIGPLKCQN